MDKKFLSLLILVLLSTPVLAKFLWSDDTVRVGEATYGIQYLAGTNADPRRGMATPEENQAFRQGLLNKLTNYAEGKLSTVKSWPDKGVTTSDGAKDESKSILGVFIAFIAGSPDEAKTGLRDNLRLKAKAMLKNARINVQIGEDMVPLSNATQQTDMEEHLYLLTDGEYTITASGFGRFNSPTMWVKTDYATFEQVTSGQLEAKEALRTRRVTFGGSGVANRFRSLVFNWLSKYA